MSPKLTLNPPGVRTTPISPLAGNDNTPPRNGPTGYTMAAGNYGTLPPKSGPTNFTMASGNSGTDPPRSGPMSFMMTPGNSGAGVPRNTPTNFVMSGPPNATATNATNSSPIGAARPLVATGHLADNPFAKAAAKLGLGASQANKAALSSSSVFPPTNQPARMGNHVVEGAASFTPKAAATAPSIPSMPPATTSASIFQVPAATSSSIPFTAPGAAPMPFAQGPAPSLPPFPFIQPTTVPMPLVQASILDYPSLPFLLPAPAPVPFAQIPTTLPSMPFIQPANELAINQSYAYSALPSMTWGFSQRLYSSFKANCVRLANTNKVIWEALVGLLLQEGETAPYKLGLTAGENDWLLCSRRLDLQEKDPNRTDIARWLPPQPNSALSQYVNEISQGNRQAFEDAIKEWALTADHGWVAAIVRMSGYRNHSRRDQTNEWKEMDYILKLPDGEERSLLMAKAKEASPRFHEECKRDIFCGTRKYLVKHIPSEADDPAYEYKSEYEVREFRVTGSDAVTISPTSEIKKLKVDMSVIGQPTQFHGVPLEERAIDSKGNRLPWSLEYHEDHPSARGQKRHVEEKGPFGKSTRRKGSSRTRTTTPAKKENPTLDGFDRALKYDAQLAAEQQAANATARAQVDGNLVSRNTPSHTKEPTQIMIYGYTPSRCYAAIDLYEKVSGGMICEDYPREPPSELQKYQTPLSTSWSVHSRPRTRQEMALANKYAGGNCWIKLTCDSAEAAARAVELSPRQVYGHWVYAELYNGKAPENDQPIPITEEDRSEGPFNSPRPPRKSSQTLSAAFSQHATTQKRANSTLPRNFTSKPDFQAADNGYSASPSTASSATATGADNSTLRNRHESQTEQSTVTTRPDEIAPGIPRYILRPESEALLPQKTWWERQYQWLSAKGLIPGDFIGNQLPILDNGEFDWANASWYWRSCYWLDSHIGTDICGLKEKDE